MTTFDEQVAAAKVEFDNTYLLHGQYMEAVVRASNAVLRDEVEGLVEQYFSFGSGPQNGPLLDKAEVLALLQEDDG